MVYFLLFSKFSILTTITTVKASRYYSNNTVYLKKIFLSLVKKVWQLLPRDLNSYINSNLDCCRDNLYALVSQLFNYFPVLNGVRMLFSQLNVDCWFSYKFVGMLLQLYFKDYFLLGAYYAFGALFMLISKDLPGFCDILFCNTLEFSIECPPTKEQAPSLIYNTDQTQRLNGAFSNASSDSDESCFDLFLDAHPLLTERGLQENKEGFTYCSPSLASDDATVSVDVPADAPDAKKEPNSLLLSVVLVVAGVVVGVFVLGFIYGAAGF